MRIALVCPYAWDDPGGVQTHVRELGERLLGRGHAVMGLAPVRSEAVQGWVRAVGRPVDLRYNRSNVPLDPRPWSARIVGRHLRAFGPHVVHLHEPFAPSTSLWALLTAKAPLVATFHSGAVPARLYDLAGPVLRRLVRRIAVRIAVSEAAGDVARQRLGGSFEVVPNPVDVARFAGAPPADLGPGPKLLFVGRLDERKGFRVAVEAFARLASDRPELRLVVAGDGPERSAVERLPAGVRERIAFLGSVANEDLPPIHAACDVFVAPNVGGESFGIVLVEAMAAGLPIVASAIPGFTEVLRDDIEGLLIPPRDPAATATAIARVLDDPPLAARLGGSGRERALGYSWDAVLPRIEAAYARADERRPTTG